MAEQEPPDRVRLVKRGGIFDGHWYYPDAAIMPFDAEFEYARVTNTEAPAVEAIVEAVADFDDWEWCKCSECKVDARAHAVDTGASLSAVVTLIRQAAAASTVAPAESPEAPLTQAEFADIERFQAQRRKHPVPEDAWLYVAEIDRLLAHIRIRTAPLCDVHQRLEDADALECEIGNDCVACSLNERRELLELIAPFAAEGNTEDSVTVLRRVVEFYKTHVGDNRVIVSYPAPTAAPLAAKEDELKTGGFTCECCGRNMEVRVNGKFCNECAGYRATSSSSLALKAAEEIVLYANQRSGHAEGDEWFNDRDVDRVTNIILRVCFGALTRDDNQRSTP